MNKTFSDLEKNMFWLQLHSLILRRLNVAQAWLQASLTPERGVTWAQASRERIGNASILSACSIYRPGEVYALANMQRADVIEKERAGQYCKSACYVISYRGWHGLIYHNLRSLC